MEDYIDRLQQGQNPPPTSDEERLASELHALSRSISADFIDRLEQELLKEKPPMKTIKFRRLVAVMAAVMMIAVVPTLAQDIHDFFTQSDDDTQSITVSVMEGIPTDVEVIEVEPDAEGNIVINPYEPLEDAPFAAWQPTDLPTGYTLEDSGYLPMGEATTLTYVCGMSRVSIFQRQMSAEQFEMEQDMLRTQVGASATVESIPLREVTAEYVQGRWSAPGINLDLEPGESAEVQQEWVNDPAAHSMAWYEDGFFVRITTIPADDCTLSREDVVTLAASMR
jgi:hypothetical protein